MFMLSRFMLSKRKITVIWIAIALAMFAAGCKKKVPASPPPPPPPPPVETPAPAPAPVAPRVVQFSAEPTSIQRGQSSTLRWEVSGNVTSVSINQGIGTVQNTGSRSVSPSDSTNYTLTAAGPGGSTTASATVNVSAPAPAVTATPPGTPRVSLGGRIENDLRDAYFDYDKTDLRSDARDALTRDAAALKAILADFPGASIIIEGHCDERGSAEYNLGLGDRRANSAKEFLQQLGVDVASVKIVSYGKERPQCTEQNEACWQKNRRVHFAAGQ
jgi:peptidoglycan-associated lipoprotein